MKRNLVMSALVVGIVITATGMTEATAQFLNDKEPVTFVSTEEGRKIDKRLASLERKVKGLQKEVTRLHAITKKLAGEK